MTNSSFAALPSSILVLLGIVALSVLLGLIILFVPVIRRLVWWLFSFDHSVERILNQKKSSEVRLGKIVETISPFLDEFPIDVKKEGTSTVFIGQPIDFLHFDPDEGITFIEVKSGNSKLSETQRRLKTLVKEGKVRWVDLRIK